MNNDGAAMAIGKAVTLKCSVTECVPEETARACMRGDMKRDGWVMSQVEDRTADGEGWACVSYFLPDAPVFGYSVRLYATKLPAVLVPQFAERGMLEPIDPPAAPPRPKTLTELRWERHKARMAAECAAAAR